MVSAGASLPGPRDEARSAATAGLVEVLGAGAHGVKEGDPVAVYGAWGCGYCRTCATGAENYCPNAAAMSIPWPGFEAPGFMAEYALVPSSRHLVPLGAVRRLWPPRSGRLRRAAPSHFETWTLTVSSLTNRRSPFLWPGQMGLAARDPDAPGRRRERRDPGRDLGPPGHAELRQDVLDVGTGRLGGDAELRGDPRVRAAGGDQPRDL